MRSRLLRICGLGALVVCAACLSGSEAQAGGRRQCHCQPMYAASTTCSAVPSMASTSTTADGRQRYQSAYQAPAAPAQSYYYNNPSPGYRRGISLWDQQVNDARHVKGL